MKASAFDYARTASIGEALQLLALHGERARVLSGGQSLMPAMNLRLVAPELIVDIGQLDELRGIAVNGDVLSIGALTRHVELLESDEIAVHAPLLADAVSHIAHPAIRNRGTLGGSLAHADPAAELPACMLALNATIVVRGQGGERRIAASDFFTGIFQTALEPNELVVGVELPVVQTNSVHFFREFARRHGDYAIAGLAGQAIVVDGRFDALRLAFLGVGDRPLLIKSADRLIHAAVTPTLVSEATTGVGYELDPHEDQQASASMRKHLAKVLFSRCIAEFLGREGLGGAVT